MMTSTKTPSAAQMLLPYNWKKLPKYFKGGNDAQREAFTRWKRTVGARTYRQSTDLLPQAQQRAEWEIPREKGFRIFPPGTFPETEELMQTAREVVARATRDRAKSNKSQILQRLLDMKQLTLDSPHVKFGLREDILDAITVYLGIAPVLEDIDIWNSISVGSDTWDNSQLWHCDSIDLTQIKIFLYSNDVGADSGPLTVVSADASKRVRDALDYKYIGEARVPDEEINKLVSGEEIQPITGPAGTCVFVDTSRCFHYGSRVREGASSRIITLYQYLSPTAFVFPIDYRRKAPLRRLAAPQLSPLQRAVLGAE